jgi:hypothetical protein
MTKIGHDACTSLTASFMDANWPTRQALDHPVNQLLFQAMQGLLTMLFAGAFLRGSHCRRMKRGQGPKSPRSWLPQTNCRWNDDRSSGKRATKRGQMPCGNDDISPSARTIEPFDDTLAGAKGHDLSAVAYEAADEEVASEWWQQDPCRAGCQRNGGNPGQLLLNEGQPNVVQLDPCHSCPKCTRLYDEQVPVSFSC